MDKRTSNLAIFLLLLLTFLIWSNSFIAIKVLLAKLSAYDLLRLRFIPVALISMALLIAFYRGEAKAILKAHPARVIAGGLLMVVSYNIMLNSGMKYVQPNAASLLIALNPLLTLLLAVRFLGEPFSRRRLLGTAVTWIPLAKLPYALLVLGGPLSWAVATVIIKPALENHSPLVFNFVAMAVGSLPLVFLIDRPFIARALALRPLEWGAARVNAAIDRMVRA